jgi:RHS repeat-associated protein
MSYYPYGEEKTSTADGREKFGTYTRDVAPYGFGAMDYADQRYYAVGMGRFGTADPYRASAGAGDPSSWNRYTYLGDDPVNFNDPTGKALRLPDPYCSIYPDDPGCKDPCGPGPNPNFQDGTCSPSAPPRPAPPPPKPVECNIVLKSSGLGVFAHTSLYMSVYDPNTGDFQDATIEGLPIPQNPDGDWIGQILTGHAWLNESLEPGSRPDTEVYDFSRKYDNSTLCSKVTGVFGAYSAYRNDTVTYGFFLGPNSNTYLAYMLQQANLTLPAGIAFPLCLTAPGFCTNNMPPNP